MGLGLVSGMRSAGIEAGATGCSACRLQMEQGTTKPAIHPVKILAKAYGLLEGPAPHGLDGLFTSDEQPADHDLTRLLASPSRSLEFPAMSATSSDRRRLRVTLFAGMAELAGRRSVDLPWEGGIGWPISAGGWQPPAPSIEPLLARSAVAIGDRYAADG